jgi:hypothetical protein
MITMNDVGKLMHLPMADIKPGQTVPVSKYMLQAAATALQNANGRNWVPLIVKQVDQYTYEVVSHGLVYAVAQAAKLDRVWCVVTDPSPETLELTHILAGEALPKVNLTTASQDIIQAALEYLCEQPGSALKGLDSTAAAAKLATAKRQTWEDLTPISKLGKFKFATTEAVINTTKKRLDALAEIFYVSPIAPKVEVSSLKTISLKKATRDEIYQQLKLLMESGANGFDDLDLDHIADELFTEPKGKWKSLNPITRLNCGIKTAHLKALKQIFIL